MLRSLGSAVLARQRLSAKEKAREQLLNDKAEAERRQRKAENQRADAQGRLQRTKARLTRDSAFERQGYVGGGRGLAVVVWLRQYVWWALGGGEACESCSRMLSVTAVTPCNL